MEEKKRLTATKAAIAKFRVDHPIFTDEYLASLVESTYPDLYLKKNTGTGTCFTGTVPFVHAKKRKPL
jgi:hypothetical protein